MAKIRKTPVSETEYQYVFSCPACKCEHAFDNRWKFNNDYDNPTIYPSFRQRGFLGFKDDKPFYGICHSRIENGFIIYCSDCTHDLAGKKVELPDIY